MDWLFAFKNDSKCCYYFYFLDKEKEINNISTAKDLIAYLHKQNYLSENNTWFLAYMMYHVKNKELYEIIESYTIERLKNGYSVLGVYKKKTSRGIVCLHQNSWSLTLCHNLITLQSPHVVTML